MGRLICSESMTRTVFLLADIEYAVEALAATAPTAGEHQH
jgi:hypothetical protein